MMSSEPRGSSFSVASSLVMASLSEEKNWSNENSPRSRPPLGRCGGSRKTWSSESSEAAARVGRPPWAAALAVLCGFGALGYELALRGLVAALSARRG